ncbi:V-type proton ATPase subunit C isoform X1 [Apis cerana]|uniref:V-type proton ATPase subunit C n=1 Tax=Apis cerana cerana TaxID=94128 RepID=A0A2A3EAJ1_APICC|nr:V-type proton ATPase subunit C isoform X1 [Apis cerana]XP_061930714.1 V-type proton ATPase subunit C isoform X1 [Apis cerana]PBC28783.1 V-type proton ATPase subunit C [Apis cerana cerana]
MTEYWLISAPGDKTCQQTWETMNNLTSKQHSLSVNYKFHIPDLKVGTLDQLVGLSDDLGKLDAYVEQITRKVATYLGEVLEDQRDKLHENLLANNSQTSVDGESSSPEGGPDTPPNTPVTPSHKSSKEHHKQWKESEKCEPEPAACLGQHHYQRHHHHEHHHSHKHHNHPSDVEKKSSHSPQGICDVRSSNDPLSAYSCYHAHWCAASTSSTPIPSPTPTSPSLSLSSNCSSEGETRWQSATHHRTTEKADRSTSNRKSFGNDDDEDDVDQNNDQDQDQDHSGNLPNPGDLPSYITRFQWDMAKYPIKQSLRNIADIISKQVGQIDADLKTKSTTYNNLKGSLQNLEKKQTGSLLTRNLADLVKKEHFILDSEYLTTLLVIVPRANFQDWYSGYEKLTKMVVPRTTQLITQDSEYGLFTVTLFKKVIEEFKLHAREKKFIVRDFTYNEEELAAGKNEITKLVTDKKKQFGPLVRWLKVNFSECFCAWIHVKALRVFVESVLRYGLPVNFQAILLHPHRKCARRLRDVLNQHYAHLDSSATASSAAQGTQDSVDIPGLGFGQNDYFPYVYYKINVDMVDNKV